MTHLSLFLLIMILRVREYYLSSAAFHEHTEYAINTNELQELISDFLLSLLQTVGN